MSRTNVVHMQNQFGKTHTRSRKAERKTKKAVIQSQPFDHIRYGDALWVGEPANEYLGRESRCGGMSSWSPRPRPELSPIRQMA